VEADIEAVLVERELMGAMVEQAGEAVVELALVKNPTLANLVCSPKNSQAATAAKAASLSTIRGPVVAPVAVAAGLLLAQHPRARPTPERMVLR
jgi:hypothetical protein